MTGLVRKATLFCAVGVVLAGAAMAGIPSPGNSTIGTAPGPPAPCLAIMDFRNTIDPFGSPNPGACFGSPFHVIVRDANNNPVAGSSVVVDLSTCTAGNFKLADTQADPAATVSCVGKTVTKAADGSGDVCFTIIGNTNIVNNFSAPPGGAGGPPVRNVGPAAGQVCAKVFADGILLGTVLCVVNRYDLNQDTSVDGVDSSLLSDAKGENVFGAPVGYRTFGDYNCDGFVDGVDSSIQSDAKGNAVLGVTVYAGTYCP